MRKIVLQSSQILVPQRKVGGQIAGAFAQAFSVINILRPLL